MKQRVVITLSLDVVDLRESQIDHLATAAGAGVWRYITANTLDTQANLTETRVRLTTLDESQVWDDKDPKVIEYYKGR